MKGRLINKITFLTLYMGLVSALVAQPVNDSLPSVASAVSKKLIGQMTDKADKYYQRITDKTERTLTKLAKWEGKIKILLEKASPETAQKLFGNGQLTFTEVLSKYKEGKQVMDDQRTRYDEYRDQFTTTIQYLDERKEILDSGLQQPVENVKYKTTRLNEQVKNTEEVQVFIKERKKQLLEQAAKHIGKSKYLQKINKEAYYYAEALRNYKEIFSDPRKAEETAMQLLKKIPSFSDFLRKNSMLAALFGLPQTPYEGGGLASLQGLQTRAQVNSLIQQQIAAGGPNAQQQFQQNVQEAQSQLNQLKDKVFKAGASSGEDGPDSYRDPDFKPNTQKSKTFKQRLEYAASFQTQRATNFFPATSDIGLSLGYKLNDKSVIGIGASYKLGWGRGWDQINITHQGMGLRSFIDIKLKGSFWISGGYEQNYRPIHQTGAGAASPLGGWGVRKSGLLGLSKVVSVKIKFFKKTKASLLWDFLSYREVPRGQAVVVRVGYSFK